MTKQEQMYQLIERQQALATVSFWNKNTSNYTLSIIGLVKETSLFAFIPVDITSRDSGKNQIELIYPNQVKIRLEHFDLKQIEQLIRLSSCSV